MSTSVGIDNSSTNHSIHVIDEKGSTLEVTEIENAHAGLKSCFKFLQSCRIPGSGLSWGMGRLWIFWSPGDTGFTV